MPITLEITASLLENQTNVIKNLGLIKDADWPTADTMDILPLIYETLNKAEPSGFETWLIVRKDTKQIIGDIGFHGKPNEQGEAEMGYGVIEKEWGQGFGFEAVKAIFSWAVTKGKVNVLKAASLLDNTRSARILEKIGMREVRRDNELRYFEWQQINSDILVKL